MKLRDIQFCAILVILFSSSCVKDDQDYPPSDYNLSHHFEPHVTKRHYSGNASEHCYSVMLIVEKDIKVYAAKVIQDSTIKMYYSFEIPKGRISREEIASKKYRIDDKHELRLYDYPLNPQEANFSFLAEVVSFPSNQHGHNHDKLHKGTLHKPTDD